MEIISNIRNASKAVVCEVCAVKQLKVQNEKKQCGCQLKKESSVSFYRQAKVNMMSCHWPFELNIKKHLPC